MAITISEIDDNVRTRTGVVVSATHPALGPLYWELISEASVGGPDYYSITTSMGGALLLDESWRSTCDFACYGGHIKRVLREHAREYRDPEYWGVDLMIDFDHRLGALHAMSGQTEAEFVQWLRDAEWMDTPGPVRVEHLEDHGYIHEWELHSQTLPGCVQSMFAQ